MYKEKKSILIVDDSILLAERLIDMLKSMENVDSIKHAGTYAEAMVLLEQTKLHIVFLDISLPDKSGVALLSSIKKNYPDIMVIMFTNQAGDYYRTLCMKKGANYFIDKSKDFELIPGIISSLN